MTPMDRIIKSLQLGANPDLQATTFAGPKSKTADQGALSMAQSLEAQGSPKEQVLKSTGWFKGEDGNWKYEIDDSGAKLKQPFSSIGNSPLDQVLDHPALFQAYPGLRNVQVDSAPMKPAAPGEIETRGATRSINGQLSGMTVRSTTDDQKLSTLLHEAGGHGVQKLEGFTPGSSPDEQENRILTGGKLDELDKIIADLRGKKAAFDDKLKHLVPQADGRFMLGKDDADLFDQRNIVVRQINKGMDDQEAAIKAARANGIPQSVADRAFTNYENVLGEREARAIQSRSKLTPQQRIQQAPWVDISRRK